MRSVAYESGLRGVVVAQRRGRIADGAETAIWDRIVISRRERLISITAAIGVPLSVLLVLLLAATPKIARRVPARMAMFDVPSASSVAPPKPRPKLTAEPKMPVILLQAPSETSLSPQVVSLLAEASAQAGACDLTVPVEAALRDDPAVADAVATIPSISRSVANAIMLWNEDWLSSPEIDPTSLATIQAAIVSTIKAATPDCREAIQSGPRFIALDDVGATIMVIGSDEWRWQDLVTSPNISVSRIPRKH